MKKLTLSADPDVVDMAKKLAAARGTSISAMFSQFIRALADKPQGAGKVGPATRRMTGIAKPRRGKTDRRVLEDALVQRYTS
jgi:hypothetical protein